MAKVILKSLSARNFKCFPEVSIDFSDKVNEICGSNGTGKTTIYDLFDWILFDTNSHDESDKGLKSFSRPKDTNGKTVDNIDVEGIAVLDVNGREVTLKKTQRQKWQRVRGTDQVNFKGNENIFEIDGVQKKQSEYEEFINSILDKEHIKLLTDIYFFESLPETDRKSGKNIEKGRRSYLLELAGDVTAESIINEDPEKWEPIKQDVLTLEFKDAMSKAKADKANAEKQQNEIPVRIDELSRQVQSVPDASEYQNKLNDLTAKYAEEKAECEAMKADATLPILKKRKAEVMEAISSISSAKKAEVLKVHDELAKEESVKKSALRKINYDLQETTNELLAKQSKVSRLQEDLNILGKEYKEIIAREFDENQKYCKACGQVLPKDKIDAIKLGFENRKKADAEAIIREGNKVKADIKTISTLIEDLEKRKADITANELKAEEEYRKAKEQLDSYSISANLQPSEEYVKLVDELKDVEQKISNCSKHESDLRDAENRVAEINISIQMAHNDLARIDAIKKSNSEIQARIEELEEDRKTLGQLAANAERRIILLEEFSITQSRRLSERINGCFEVARFQLTDEYQSGGVSAGCKIVYNGIQEKSINTGHRIRVLMDIVKTFQRHYDFQFPLFIDNAECLSSDNQPEMDCQLIMLKVSDDEKLKVVTK